MCGLRVTALTKSHPLTTDIVSLSYSYVTTGLSYDHHADIRKRDTKDELNPVNVANVHGFVSFVISLMMNSKASLRWSNGP